MSKEILTPLIEVTVHPTTPSRKPNQALITGSVLLKMCLSAVTVRSSYDYSRLLSVSWAAHHVVFMGKPADQK
jgi:hypothetical protein